MKSTPYGRQLKEINCHYRGYFYAKVAYGESKELNDKKQSLRPMGF